MHTEILSKYSLWYILPLLLFSALVSWYLYRNDDKFTGLDRWKIYLMGTSRFLSIFFISFFLLSIVLRYVRLKFEDPIIVVAHDNSESINLGKKYGSLNKEEYIANFKEFLTVLDELSDVKHISFGEQLSDSISFSFIEKETNFTQLFQTLEKQFQNSNVGAFIIASDGIYNRGTNPIYLSRKLNFPIYIVALGDSSRKKDIYINDILTNSIAFLGDEFPIEIQLGAFGFKNENLVLDVTKDGKSVVKENIVVDSKDFFKKYAFDISADSKGLQHYKIKVTTIEDEFTTSNNFGNFVIDVIDDKKKVLILANSVHPDISAIRESLKSNKNLLVDFFTIDDFKGNILDYQLAVFHQLPSYKSNAQNQILKLGKAKIPSLFILGSQTNVKSLNTLNGGFKILKNKKGLEFVVADFNHQFNLFETEQIQNSNLSEFPPLVAPFGEYQIDEKADILLFQEIRGIKTDKPLILIFSEQSPNLGKHGFINGEGLWRWRINDFVENGNHNHFDNLMDRIVHYLSLDLKKERFIISSKRIFNENESVNFRADFYNKSYELVNKLDVSLEITDEKENSFNYIFSPTSSSYSLDAGQLPIGKYNYIAKISTTEQNFSKSGSFIVVPLNVESINTRANFQMLYQLASENSGKLFSPDSLNDLLKNIKDDSGIRPISFTSRDLIDLIELRWILFIILFLLSIEWFMRKFFGSY